MQVVKERLGHGLAGPLVEIAQCGHHVVVVQRPVQARRLAQSRLVLDRVRIRSPRREDRALQRDLQQAVLEARLARLDEVGELEAPLESVRRDAAVQVGARVTIVAALADDGKQVLLGDDLDVLRPKPATASVIR